MSRSRRKTPVISVTTAETEKDDKRIANRRYRHAVKQRVKTKPDIDILPDRDEYGDPWNWDKDGKQRFDADRHPEWLRK